MKFIVFLAIVVFAAIAVGGAGVVAYVLKYNNESLSSTRMEAIGWAAGVIAFFSAVIACHFVDEWDGYLGIKKDNASNDSGSPK